MGRAAGAAGLRPLQRSRRLTVRTAALQAVYAGSNPAGNAKRGCSSVDRAIALQAKDAGLIPAFSTKFKLAVAQIGQRASFGTRRPQVRILPARPHT